MSEPKADRGQISRGADLTDEDLETLANDARIVCLWCMRNRIKRPEWNKQVREALRARLGRRPLVIAPRVGESE